VNKPDKSSIFKTSLLVALVGSACVAQAAGLGRLTVYSAIGQPLNAEVDLTASREEMTSLTAKLASHDAFKEAGIEFSPVLTGLRLNVGRSNSGNPVLTLTTNAPLNEPFLHFLVELNWTSGRMVREYTFLLDPPELLQAPKPTAVVAPAAPAVKPIDAAGAAGKPAVRPMPSPSTAEGKLPKKSAVEVQVKRGDTLTRIAVEHKPEAVTLDQMLVALFNTNREAFDANNMNRLRAGKILKVPDEETVARVDTTEARQMIFSQARDFNAYRRRLAEAASGAAEPAPEPQQQVAGKIKPKVEEKAPPAPVADKLEVSRTETSKTAGGGGVDKVRLEEELIARDKALQEASERIAQLEKNLASLKQLAEVKSQAGAAMQKQAEAPVPPAPKEAKPEPVPAPTPAMEAKPAEPPAAASAPAAVAKTEAPTPAPQAADQQEKPPAPPPKPPVKKAAPPPPPPPEPSFIEDNPELVLGGGGLIALLLGYFGYNAWRRKKQAREAAEYEQEAPAFMAEAELSARGEEAASVAVTPAASEDVSVLGDFSESGALTSEESVDPVAEADVLMAYGRDVQAEEILLEGLKTDPTRTAIHAKLLELYANRKDVERFQSVAEELHGISHGEGADWSKANALSRDLGIAGTGLFAAAVATAGLARTAEEPDEISPASIEEQEAASKAEEVRPLEREMVEPPAPPSEPEEVASLDFDLDLGTTSKAAESTQAAQPAPAAQPAAADVMSLDFDFDLGTPEAPAAASAEKDEDAEPADVTGEMGNANLIDFSLDLEEPPAGSPATEAAAADADAGNEIDFDLGLDSGQESAGTEAPEAADGEVAELQPPADLGMTDISLDLEPDVGDEAVASADLVMPEIGLDSQAAAVEAPVGDLAESEMPEVQAPAAETAAVPAAEADDPEVATKLELAQAYEEMGDFEGARELLNEVVSEGSAGQQALARERLDKLSA
jgi:pilus assembly protein FimV